MFESETVQNFFMYVGVVTVGIFGFLLFCTTAFFALLLEDRWREHRKAQYGKHQKAKLVSVPDQEVIQNFFPMTDEDEKQERLRQKDLANIERLRQKLARNDETVANVAGWETEGSKYEPLDKDYQDTVLYPAFNMKGEAVESHGAHKA